MTKPYPSQILMYELQFMFLQIELQFMFLDNFAAVNILF